MSNQAWKCYSSVTGAVLPGLTIEDALTFLTLYYIRSIERWPSSSPFPLQDDNTKSPFLLWWKGRAGFGVI